MPLNNQEKLGIQDLFLKDEHNIPLLVQLARSITKNVCRVTSAQEALEYIFTHIEDPIALLNKRLVTKEILFKYLHNRKISVTEDFTKAALISKIISYWNKIDVKSEPPPYDHSQQTTEDSYPQSYSNSSTIEQRIVPSEVGRSDATSSSQITTEAQYPIHLLARKFSEWFFENYNKNSLKIEDFWSDARLLLRIAASDCIDDKHCTDSGSIIEVLVQSKTHFGFYFNPNLTHLGVQGRMDVHGLVLVLACGTLHTEQNSVGVFECTFGLLRDPFAENNWKVKTIQLLMRSQITPSIPNLYESDSLRDALALPVPMEGEFT